MLGVGVIGCGAISDTYFELAPLFAGIEIRACADLKLALAAEKAARYGLRAEGVAALIAADDIDIVVNLTAPKAHFEVSLAALEGGVHVYSEKPFALNLEEGRALVAAAKRAGRVIASAPDTFLGGAHQQARALIDAGAIGQVTAGTAFVMGPGMEGWHPNPDFFFQPGGGPVLDMGPYYLTNLVQLMGPVARVGAMAGAARSERVIGRGARAGEAVPVATPTHVQALLEFESGALVTLGASWDVVAHRHGEMELYGTKGALFLPDPNFFGGSLQIAGPDGEIAEVACDGHPFGRVNQDSESGVVRANYRAAGLAEMAAAIGAGRAPRCGADLALHVLEAMKAVLLSAAEGRFIGIRSRPARPAPLSAEEALGLMAEG